MEYLNLCPFCNSSERDTVGIQIHKDKYLSLIDENLNKLKRVWYKCCDCGFIYRSPRIEQDEESILYQKYRNKDVRGISAQEYFLKLTSLSSSESISYEITQYISNNVNNENIESILDVGCGGGILLYHMNKFFPKAKLVGLEPNKEYCDVVKKNLKIKVINDYYRKGLLSKKFDLVLSTDVIEHIADIVVFWEAVRDNIKKDKYLFISIPSQKYFEERPISDDVFEAPHLYFFQKKHVESIGKKYGFKLYKCRECNKFERFKLDFIFKFIG